MLHSWCLTDCSLNELFLHGYGFTWERSRGSPHRVQEKLDRCFAIANCFNICFCVNSIVIKLLRTMALQPCALRLSMDKWTLCGHFYS